MAEVVAENRMPPWHANPEYGSYKNDRSLSPDQKATLLAWVEAGCPEGDPVSEPTTVSQEPSVWQMGTPDAVFTMPRPYRVKAEGTVPYQMFVVPTNLSEDRWVQAIEIKPGNRAVVHHILVFVVDGSGANLRELAEEGGAGGGQFAGYVPGDEPTVYPVGMGKRLPAGSRLAFQVHYTPIGKVVEDQSAIAVKFATEPVRREVRTKGIHTRNLRIPPREPSAPAQASFTVPSDITLLSLWPHMHLRGKDFRFTAVYPDQRGEVLLDVPAYDFNWQTTYVLAEPRFLPKGTRIDCLAHFDNSEDNPNNPNPDVSVRWGPQTTDEMMIGYIDFVTDAPVRNSQNVARGRFSLRVGGARDRIAGLFGNADRPVAERAQRLIEQFDTNGDGVVRKDEVPNPAIFSRLDRNGDDAITRDEVAEVLELMRSFQNRRGTGTDPADPQAPPSRPSRPREGEEDF
jgi:hypothetical protein